MKSSATLSLRGVAELKRKLMGLPDKAKKQVLRPASMKTMREQLGRIRPLAPVGPTENR